MKAARSFILATVFELAFVAGGSASVQEQETAGNVVNRVGFDQKLGVQLPLGLRFRDESGRELTPGRPVRPQARDPRAGLLPLPAALQPGFERPDSQPEAAVARRRQGFRRRRVQHQPGREARVGGRRSWHTSSVTTGPAANPAGTS